MLTRSVSTKIVSAVFTVCGMLSAQVPNPTQHEPINAAGAMPVYTVTVVERATKTINYHSRSGATKIDFRGTPLLPKAHGEAKVESKQGYMEIEVEFDELQSATAYGPEYLTYVMWAITPEGRTSNLGEILLNGNRAKVNVTTEMQSFGLIVTAEPYYAVTQPSDVVVMENVVRKDTVGAVEQVDAKYELLKRGQYVLNVTPGQLKPVRLDKDTPLELYEARNAVQIARWTGAEKYAAETFAKATADLAKAEGYLKRKAGRKPIMTVSRESVQMSEDARIITIKKMQEESLANERQASAERELRAEAGQRSAAAGQLLAESERAAAQSETDRIRRDAEAAENRSSTAISCRRTSARAATRSCSSTTSARAGAGCSSRSPPGGTSSSSAASSCRASPRRIGPACSSRMPPAAASAAAGAGGSRPGWSGRSSRVAVRSTASRRRPRRARGSAS